MQVSIAVPLSTVASPANRCGQRADSSKAMGTHSFTIFNSCGLFWTTGELMTDLRIGTAPVLPRANREFFPPNNSVQ